MERPTPGVEGGNMERSHDVLRFPFARSTPGIARTKLAGFLTVNRVASAASTTP